MAAKKLKRPKRNLKDEPLWRRLLIGLRVGIIQAAVVVGALLVAVVIYGLIFPDSALPNLTNITGGPRFVSPQDGRTQALEIRD